MKKFVLVVAALAVAQTALAEGSKKQAPAAAAPAAAPAAEAKKPAMAAGKSFARNYGMAGCGLGSIVIDKNGAQILAATTNGTAYNQVFGITFGTSNCIDSESEQVASRVDRFVTVNKVALAGDVARGEGETLASLSMMLNCSDSARFNSALQGRFGQIFPSYEVPANEVTDSIITTITTDSSLAETCKLGV
jgi:hypothetical protein